VYPHLGALEGVREDTYRSQKVTFAEVKKVNFESISIVKDLEFELIPDSGITVLGG
jgi:hypothetical protein